MALTLNVDATYADDAGDASRKIHQQDHDILHPIARTSKHLLKVAQLPLRGVNVAGAEFGNVGDAYGGSWAHENAASFAYLAGRGHKLIRYPFL
jgi:hypothetical protein